MNNLTKKLIDDKRYEALIAIETARVTLLNEGYTQVRWAHTGAHILWVRAIKPTTGKTYFLNRSPFYVTAMFGTVDLNVVLDIIRIQYKHQNACVSWALAINDVTGDYFFDPIELEQYEHSAYEEQTA